MSLPLVIIIGYLVVVTLVGALLARRNTSSKQWDVAGGGMGIMRVAVGVTRTRTNGAGTLDVAALPL